MKISVELSPAEIKSIQKATGRKHRAEAVRVLALEALKLKKRHALSDLILAREWAVDLPDLAKLRKDRSLS
jgi:hypothetical protein